MSRKQKAPEELRTKVEFPVWGFTVHLIFSKSAVDSRKKRDKLFKRVYDDGPACALHCTITGDESGSYIFLPLNTGIESVVHECCHAIWRIQQVTGAEFCNETAAYHTGHLVAEVCRFMDKMNSKYL